MAQEFLGHGLLRPFRRDQKADFAADGGEAVVRSAVGQILMKASETRTWVACASPKPDPRPLTCQ